MIDITALAAAIQQLASDVAALVTALNSGTAQQASIDALTTQVQSLDQSVVAATPTTPPANPTA